MRFDLVSFSRVASICALFATFASTPVDARETNGKVRVPQGSRFSAQATEEKILVERAPASEIELAPPSASPAPETKAETKPAAKAEKPAEKQTEAPKKAAKADSKPLDPFSQDIRKHCERHFPGQIQAEVRTACASAAPEYAKLGKSLIQTRCRLNYGEEPRLVMACLVGSSVADDVLAGREDFKRKLQLCAENYPVHNEIDAFLQESCLTGIHISDLMKTDGKEKFEACAQITPERSFIGPCAVGLSLAKESSGAVSPAQQNKACEQYFNLKQFHKGYRACLNARSLAPELPTKYADALKGCSNIMGDANNDTERAACLVGLSIYRHLQKNQDVAGRFQKCGENKVTYQDRDVLACLTAASLLDFTDRGGAESGCREVFKEARSRVRGDCVNSLSLFN